MSWSGFCRRHFGRSLLGHAVASAQSPTAAARAESRPIPVGTEIVVTGERQAVATRVDRKGYRHAGPAGTLGSAAGVPDGYRLSIERGSFLQRDRRRQPEL